MIMSVINPGMAWKWCIMPVIRNEEEKFELRDYHAPHHACDEPPDSFQYSYNTCDEAEHFKFKNSNVNHVYN